MGYYQLLNMLIAFAASIVCGYVVLARSIDEGLCIKLGLSMMSFGAGSTGLLLLFDIDTFRGLTNAGMLLRAGIVVAALGYFLKTRRRSHQLRRSTDWSTFDDVPHHHWGRVVGRGKDAL